MVKGSIFHVCLCSFVKSCNSLWPMFCLLVVDISLEKTKLECCAYSLFIIIATLDFCWCCWYFHSVSFFFFFFVLPLYYYYLQCISRLFVTLFRFSFLFIQSSIVFFSFSFNLPTIILITIITTTTASWEYLCEKTRTCAIAVGSNKC